MPLGVAASTERAQVPKLVAPASLARENVVDVLGAPSARAQVVIAPERLEPEPSPRARTPSALRMVGAWLAVRALRHAADGGRSRLRSTVGNFE
jgi:hypothetical protein